MKSLLSPIHSGLCDPPSLFSPERIYILATRRIAACWVRDALQHERQLCGFLWVGFMVPPQLRVCLEAPLESRVETKRLRCAKQGWVLF